MLNKNYLIIFFFLFFIILILLRVAFFTLIERKIIRLNQLRIGPNKIFIRGIIQPVLDGLKLFLKNFLKLNKINIIFYLGPLFAFFIGFGVWRIFFYSRLKMKLIRFLIFIGLNSYRFILTGWARYSKFSYLGGIRACSQTISYEICLTLIILLTSFFFSNLSFFFLNEYYFSINFIILLIWIIIILAETNRAPFDFREGERELISGYNTEYGSLGFVFFILSEYRIIIFFCLFVRSMMSIKIFFVLLIFFVITRTRFPRFRYDYLINLIWFKLLPFICLLFLRLIFF